MSSYEETAFQEIETFTAKVKGDLEQTAFELTTTTMRSFEYMIDRCQFIQKYAEKIDASSTKVFIGTFLSNIHEIKTGYDSIKPYFEVIAKLHIISTEKINNNNPPPEDNDKKRRELQ